MFTRAQARKSYVADVEEPTAGPSAWGHQTRKTDIRGDCGEAGVVTGRAGWARARPCRPSGYYNQRGRARNKWTGGLPLSGNFPGMSRRSGRSDIDRLVAEATQ